MRLSPKKSLVANLSSKDLGSQGIHSAFLQGRKAVCLSDPRIQELWNRIVLNSPPEPSGSGGWKEFWNNGVFTFLRNHYKYKTDYGDLFWFEPEMYGYIARKIVIHPEGGSGKMRIFPAALFNDGDRQAQLAPETLQLAWDLGMDVLRSAMPRAQIDPNDYVLHIEMLKYPESYAHLQRMFDFLNVGSVWKRVGIKLDLQRIRARGFFARRFVRDLFAWASLIPILKKVVLSINDRIMENVLYKLEDSYAPVGQAHVDGSRFLTMLASERDVMKTEAFGEGRWEELPMSSDKFIVFPGTFYDKAGNIKPTLHRYSILTHSLPSQEKKLNLTFVLGISTRKFFEERIRDIPTDRH